MKNDHLFIRIISLVGILGLCALSPVQADSDDDTPLTKTMEETSEAIKTLRKIDRDDWKSGAELARKAADGIRRGMEYIPWLIEEMPDGLAKTKAIADYRRLMGLSYADLCELELAYLDQDAEKVDEVMTRVKAGKKEGHKKYSDD